MPIHRVRPDSLAYPPYFPRGEGLLARFFVRASSEYLQGTTQAPKYPMTMACWYNSSDTTNYQVLMSTSDPSQTYYSALVAAGGRAGDPFEVWENLGSIIAATTTGYSANTWHHACGVWVTTTDRRVFIDGGSRGNNTQNDGASHTPNTARIGVSADSTPYGYTNGSIAVPAIWDVPLTDPEVYQLAHGKYPWEIRPQNLQGFWLVGPRSDRDYSGQGNHMTPYNTPTWAPGPHQKMLTPSHKFPMGFVEAAPGGLSIPVAMHHYMHKVFG